MPGTNSPSDTGLHYLKSMRLLFADDDRETADSMRAILGHFFAEVMVVHDGRAAQDGYQSSRPDVVLLDVAMPQRNGLEVAQWIRSSDTQTPIGILTSLDGKPELLQAIPLGLVDYLLKPVNAAKLRGFLGRCVQQLEQQGRLRHEFPNGTVFYPTQAMVEGALGTHSLSRNEQRFLQLMLRRRGQVVENAVICDALCDDVDELSLQGLRNLVHRLRQKIGHDTIDSQKGLGYRLP